MMTETRRDRVLVALDALLPQAYTWEERDEPEWLTAFPAGIAPLFVYGTTVSVNPDRIVETGATLEPFDFESLLDALIEWVIFTMTDFQSGLSGDEVIVGFEGREPVHSMVLAAVARKRGLPLKDFLGADHGNVT